MHIRPISDADFAPCAALMRALSLEFILPGRTPDAVEAYLGANDEAGLRKFAASGIAYHVALQDGRVAGFVAVRERSHLYHLFVERTWHGRGIGRALWEVARQHAIDGGGNGDFTVNASDYAVPAYEAFGFGRSSARACFQGLECNPMRLAGAGNSLVGAA